MLSNPINSLRHLKMVHRYLLIISLLVFKNVYGHLGNQTVIGIEKYTDECLRKGLDITFCFPSQELSSNKNQIYQELLLESRLKNFFSEMSSFITQINFSYINFEPHIERLKTDLDTLEHSFKMSDTRHEHDISLEFVRAMFWDMVDATRQMKRNCKASNETGHILFELYDLKIKIYKIQNINGHLNQQSYSLNGQMYSPEKQLYMCFKVLYALEKDLNEATNVSTATSDNFRTQFEKIKFTLENLECSILSSIG